MIWIESLKFCGFSFVVVVGVNALFFYSRFVLSNNNSVEKWCHQMLTRRARKKNVTSFCMTKCLLFFCLLSWMYLIFAPGCIAVFFVSSDLRYKKNAFLCEPKKKLPNSMAHFPVCLFILSCCSVCVVTRSRHGCMDVFV